MPQLLVRKIEDKVVRKLKERAGKHGVSMEEEHRRILREALMAATPLVHDLTVISRDADGFQTTGARFVNPFSKS